MIPIEDWKWFGLPGHLCIASECRFHMVTQVGKYLISTIGEYVYKGKRTEIGLDRYFETMVFIAGKPCKNKGCLCGMPEISGEEIDDQGYKTEGEAQVGHMKLCWEYANRETLETEKDKT